MSPLTRHAGRAACAAGLLAAFTIAGTCIASAEDDSGAGRAQPPGYALSDGEMREYESCKADAYRYGVMGRFRRLYILSCLDTDVTSGLRSQ